MEDPLKKAKLTTREKIIAGVSFAAGGYLTWRMYKYMYNDHINVGLVNQQLREMFNSGAIVGTGENKDRIMQYIMK